MTNLWQDLRYALRILRKSPSFTAVAVLTLALGIGANTAIFTIVYGVLLRPLPFPEPDRLVQLAASFKEQTDELSLNWTQLNRLYQHSSPFQHIAGFTETGYNLAVGNAAEHVNGMPVAADYFRVLQVPPVLGRDFVADDDRGEGQRVAIVSHGLWTRRLGADPRAIGRTILLNGEPFIMIGVMPKSFTSLGQLGAPDTTSPEIWTPLALVAKTAGSGTNIGVIARIKPGVTQAQLDAQMNLVEQDFETQFVRDFGHSLHVMFLPYQRMIGADVRPFLFVLFGAIGFVLLIACANVANLFLARGGLRGRENAVRTALGASRRRIFQQLLTESMLVALAGGAVGLLVAMVGLSSLLALAPVDLPRASDLRLDPLAFAFTFALSLLTGALFGLAPAFDAVRSTINDSLKESPGRTSAAPGRARIRQALVVGEFAMSLVLLTGAGLMIATFSQLMRADAGFNPHPVLSMQFWLVGSKYKTSADIAGFYQALVQRQESIPGVQAAAIVAAGLPLERGGNNGVRIAGPNSSEWYNADYREITPGYFRTMGIPLRQGRVFTDADTATTARVAVVNDAFAREHFPGRSALGEHLYISEVLCEIVGVVGDVKSYLDQPAPPTMFVPAAQAGFATSGLFEGWFPRSVVVRASVDPLSLSRAVRDAVVAVDPMVPTGQMRTLEQVLSRSLALRNFMRVLLTVFASLALLLASVGIYGVISYTVSQRTREIGVRMALGARPADVLRLVLAEGLKLILVGAALGLASAFALTKLLGGLLYGVSATDPLIFSLVTVMLVGVALAACYVPAHRAMRVDPIVALRYE
jgi:putative ABC transport system permease protein